MSTPGYPDFTQPVAFLEQISADLIPGGALTANGTGVTIDTTTYSSLRIYLQVRSRPAGERYAVQMLWDESGINVLQSTISLHSAASYTGVDGEIGWVIPVQAQSCDVAAVGDASVPVTCHVFGSNRVVNSELITPLGSQFPRFLADTGTVNVGAGGSSATFYVPPVSRAYAVRLTGFAATCFVTMDGVFSKSGVLSTVPFLSVNGNGTGQTLDDLPMPGTGQELILHNTSAGAINMRAVVWDVS